MKKIFYKIILILLFSVSIFGENVEPAKYNKIVSLTLGSDEILLSLVDSERIAALSGKVNQNRDFSHIVEKAKNFPKVESNIEVLINLEPDFVIVADWLKKETLSQISDVTDNLFIYKTPNDFQSLKNLIKELSILLKVEKEGEKLIKNIDFRLKRVENKIKESYKGKKLKMMLYTSYGTTAGLNSTFDSYIELLNGINLAAEAGIKNSEKISKEKVIELNPDILIIPTWSGDKSKEFSNLIMNDDSFKSINAVKNNKVIVVRYAVTSPVSQYMVDGLEELARLIYGIDL